MEGKPSNRWKIFETYVEENVVRRRPYLIGFLIAHASLKMILANQRVLRPVTWSDLPSRDFDFRVKVDVLISVYEKFKCNQL